MPGQELNGKAVLAVAAGILFTWSGVKGWSLLGVLGDIVVGKQPSGGGPSYPIGGEFAGGTGGGGSDGVIPQGNIAATALQYDGHAYKFGGAPGTDGSQPWDCSSMVNYIVGVKHRLAIPGNAPGKYDGRSHGPPTGTWGVWPGLAKVSRSDVQAGDIIVWVGHMGIAISNKDYISALNPRTTTKVRSIDGERSGPLMIYGRLK